MFRDSENISGPGMVGSELSAVNFVKKSAHALNLPDKLDGRTVFEHIKTGKNETLNRHFEEFSRGIALLIINLQAILDLEKFLIGGGVSRQDILINEINKQYLALRNEFPVFASTFVPVEIEACKYHNNANILGAVYQLLVKLEKL